MDITTQSVMSQVVSVVLGGKTWKAKRTTMGDMADFESHLRAINVEGFLNIADKRKMNPDLVAATLDRLYNAPWSQETKVAHSQTVAGMCFFLWLSINKFNPEVTLEQISEMVPFDHTQEAMAAMNIIQASTKEPENESLPPSDAEGNPTQVQLK
jgi:hypothetical protein